MAFVLVSPEMMAAAATDVAGIGSTITAANAAAALPTTGVASAAADEVSTAIAALFSQHAVGFQEVAGQAAAFHAQFVQALNAGADAYVRAEAANVEQTLLGAVNAPTQAMMGRPLIGNGTNGAPGSETTAGPVGCYSVTAVTVGPAHPVRPAVLVGTPA